MKHELYGKINPHLEPLIRNPPKINLKLNSPSKHIEFWTPNYTKKTYVKMLNSNVNDFSTNVTPKWVIHDFIASKLSKHNPITSVTSTQEHTVANKNNFTNFFSTRLQPSKSFYKLTKKGILKAAPWTLDFFKQIFKKLENGNKIPQRRVLIDFNFLQAWTLRKN